MTSHQDLKVGYRIIVNRDNDKVPKIIGRCHSDNSLIFSLKGLLDDKAITSITIEFLRSEPDPSF